LLLILFKQLLNQAGKIKNKQQRDNRKTDLEHAKKERKHIRDAVAKKKATEEEFVQCQRDSNRTIVAMTRETDEKFTQSSSKANTSKRATIRQQRDIAATAPLRNEFSSLMAGKDQRNKWDVYKRM